MRQQKSNNKKWIIFSIQDHIVSNILYLMVRNRIVKSELEQPNSLKGCYGTSEWPENPGICCNCKLKDDCGKMNLKHLEN